MDSKKMEFKVDTNWGRAIRITVDLQFNGGRVTVEGSQQVVSIYPVKVQYSWNSKEEKFEDRVAVMSEQKGNEPIVTAEICSEKAQGWGAYNRPKLTAFCHEGHSVERLKPRLEVSASGNLLGEHEEEVPVGFAEVVN